MLMTLKINQTALRVSDSAIDEGKIDHNSYNPSHPKVNRGLDHLLHLYTLDVDKYSIQRAFLSSMKGAEEAIIVSYDDPATIRKEFSCIDKGLTILKLEELFNFESHLPKGLRPRLIFDGGSFPNLNEFEIEKKENYLSDVSRKHSISCLCTYSVSDISRQMLKQLTTFHSKLQLTTSDLTLISGDFLDRSLVSYNSIKKIVRNNLEAIILALLQKRAMCGSEIIGTVHIEFNVLLSPGAVYPLLNSLSRKGLLTCFREGKEKIYAPAENSQPEIKSLIYEQIQARKLLNNYLQKRIDKKQLELTV